MLELLPLLGIILLFWLLVLRPAQKRQRDAAQLQEALTVGDEVVLTSGIFGTVVTLDGDRAGIEVAPGTVLQVARPAVAGRTTSTDASDSDDGTEGPTDSGSTTTETQEG